VVLYKTFRWSEIHIISRITDFLNRSKICNKTRYVVNIRQNEIESPLLVTIDMAELGDNSLLALGPQEGGCCLEDF